MVIDDRSDVIRRRPYRQHRRPRRERMRLYPDLEATESRQGPSAQNPGIDIMIGRGSIARSISSDARQRKSSSSRSSPRAIT